MESTLIEKIKMSCPICDKEHDVEERERTTNLTIKGDQVTYKEKYYFCANADDDECEFETGSMSNANLLAARNAYRKKHGLLTSDEIVALRKTYGLSQVELSRLMGWGEATISRYESKAIQDESYDAMLRMIKDNPLKAIELLDKNQEKFSGVRKEVIRQQMKKQLNSYGREYLSRQTFESNYVDFQEPSEVNGYVTLDIDKLEECISYLAESTSKLFKVKLMKMLWYTDALSMKVNGKAITGLVYQHEQLGALPLGHYSLVNLERLNVQEEMSMSYTPMLHFYPIEGEKYTHLTNNDKEILDQVITKFKDYRAKEIICYMHEEVAYTQTKPDEIISFELAKQIRDF